MYRLNILFILVSSLVVGCSPEKILPGTIVSSHQGAVNIDYQNVEISALLADVAAHFHLKLDCPDVIVGTTSLKLRDVNWRQIFAVTLAPINYGFYERDGIVFVRTNEEIHAMPPSSERIILHYQNPLELVAYLNRVYNGTTRFTPTENGFVYEIRPELRQSVIDTIARLDTPDVLLRRIVQTPHLPGSVPQNSSVLPNRDRVEQATISDLESTEVFVVEHVDAILILPYLEREVRPQDRLRIDFQSNSLIVTAKASLMPRLAAVVHYLDDDRWYKSDEIAH